MTNVHAFLPGGENGLCAENFGGVTRCALPRTSEWHWQPEAEAVAVELPLYGGDSPEGAGITVNLPPQLKDALKMDADEYAWFPGGEQPLEAQKPGPDMTVGAAPDVPLGSEAERAVAWLEAADIELTYGPWPVRKFLIPDNGSSLRLGQALSALDGLEQDYSLVVSRPAGAGWRVALLTWGWALGMPLETVCAELVDRS